MTVVLEECIGWTERLTSKGVEFLGAGPAKDILAEVKSVFDAAGIPMEHGRTASQGEYSFTVYYPKGPERIIAIAFTKGRMNYCVYLNKDNVTEGTIHNMNSPYVKN